MSEPGKNDHGHGGTPSSKTGAPANGKTEKKCLHALFGNYCRTETFGTPDKGKGAGHIHCEAYMDDPVAKTWTVTKVVRLPEPSMSINPYARKIATHTHRVKSGVNFRAALEEMANFENDCREKKADFTPTYPDAAAMSFTHFKAFAEREGYIFDQSGLPQARPSQDALPPGCSFYADDLARAGKHLARPAAEFDNSGPASKAPNAHFLLDHFTQAAHSYDHNTALASLRVLNILDRFAGQVENAHAKMTEYCEKYRELGHGDLISDALNVLGTAEASVRQMKAYGVDTTDFDSFVQQCQITCQVLHAEGLYDLMNRGKGDFESNEALFKTRVGEAAEGFSKLDKSAEGLKAFKDMIVQTKELKVPPTIGQFVEKYKELRKDYSHAQGLPETPHRKPKPPRP